MPSNERSIFTAIISLLHIGYRLLTRSFLLLLTIFGWSNAELILEGAAEGINGRIPQEICNFAELDVAFAHEELGGAQATGLVVALNGISRDALKMVGEIAVIVVHGIGKLAEVVHGVDVRVDVVHDLVAKLLGSGS